MDSREHKYVHTVSIEKILSPFAERVSELIVIVADSKQLGTGLPDLSTQGSAVKHAGDHFHTVALQAMNDGDEELKESMTDACKDLDAALSTFSEAVRSIHDDPKSESSSSQLLEGVRALLYATTDILSAWDGYDIRKIIVQATELLETLSIISQSNMEDWTPQNVRTILNCIEGSMTQAGALHALVSERVPEMRNTNHRKRLKTANDSLIVRSRCLMTGMRLFLETTSSPEAWEAFLHMITEVEALVQEIIEVVMLTDFEDDTYANEPGAIAAGIQDINKQLGSDAVDIDHDALQTQVEDLCELADTVVSRHREGQLLDEQDEDPMTASIDTSEKADAILEDIKKNMETIKSNEETAEGRQELKENIDRLKTHIETATADEMTAAHIASEQSKDVLINVIEESNEPEKFDGAADNFAEQALRLVTAAENVQNISEDTEQVVKMREKSNHLLMSSEQMVRAARISWYNPSEVAQEHLQAAKVEYEKDSEEVHKAAVTMLETQKVIDVDLEAIKGLARTASSSAERGYPAAARGACRKMMKRITHILYVATLEKENTTETAVHQLVEKTSAEVAKRNNEMTKSLRELAADPKDQPKVKSFVEKVNAVVATIERFREGKTPMVQGEQSEGVDDTKTKAAEQDIQDKQEEKDEEDPPGVTAEIKPSVASLFAVTKSIPDNQKKAVNAAFKLHRQASGWLDENNPIVSTAQKMSEVTARMVKDSAKGAAGMGDIVRHAREIAKGGDVVVKHARQLAMNCTDKRLRENLLGICERIPTIGVQLKILTSVQASSLSRAKTPEDIQTDAMLVVNVQNLMDAVTKALNASHAAALKQNRTPTDNGEPAPARLSWRRKSMARKKKTAA
eukprot:m.28045 g.28045  ORF g.28045 m.28045 type:complete len:859 (-) comp7966_c0_seq2:1461-4037(-)